MTLRDYSNNDKELVQKIFEKYWTDKDFLKELSSELDNKDNSFYVLEYQNQILGIIGFRKLPNYFIAHSKTQNPLELYIIASNIKGQGIGTNLFLESLKRLKETLCSEIICYSPETHRDSWKFYESLGFISLGTVHDPEDGYPGNLFVKLV